MDPCHATVKRQLYGTLVTLICTELKSHQGPHFDDVYNVEFE